MKKYWLGVLLSLSMPAWAVIPWGATPAEQAMCQARINSRLDRSDPNSGHMHHYCDGLRFLDRAYASIGNKRDMSWYLKESLDGFDYVLRATRESYAMRGEVHVGKARALKLMGRNAEAVAEFNKALNYKLYTPDAYMGLADHFHAAGNKQKALEMVTEGLNLNPNSKGLKRRYTEFGGKLPYPDASAGSVLTKEAEVRVRPEQKSESTESVKGIAGDIPEPNKSTTIEPAPQAEPSKTGSPKNPYCRFCPD